MRERIANLTSNVLNPFAVSVAAILLLAFESTPTAADALKWAGITAGVSVLPVLLTVIYQARTGRMSGILTATRQQRTGIYVLSIACLAVGYTVLHYLQAPLMLPAAFVGGLCGVVIFSVVNLRWKVSLHTGFVSALAVMLVLLHGAIAAVAVAPVLLMGWSRAHLGQHSVAEVVAGGLLGAMTVVAVFEVFGLP